MKNMLRVLCAVLCLLLSAVCAAEEAAYEYIRVGDTGSIVLKLQAILGLREWDDGTDEARWGEECAAALSELQAEWSVWDTDGVLDAETLFWLMNIAPKSAGDEKIVWVPMHGGRKYHSKETCSGMIEPRQMPVLCAEWLELTPCARCYKQ